MHEAQMHEENSFITLTYEDKFLPRNNSLYLPDFQKFMKRLRKAYTGKEIRFFHAGEYGEKLQRPHYHAILFGLDFKDKVFFKRNENGNPWYLSEELEKLWSKGNCLVGDVEYDSAAYVAKYTLKKITGEKAEGYYGDRLPEYSTMSRRPGIGKSFFDKYKGEIYPDDFVVMNGGKIKPPRYYDDKMKDLNSDLMDEIKEARKYSKKRYEKHFINGKYVLVSKSELGRMLAKEKVMKAKLKLKKGTLED